MALPKLHDYLPPRPGQETVALVEERLSRIEGRAAALRQAIEHYVQDVEACTDLDSTDVGAAFLELTREEGRSGLQEDLQKPLRDREIESLQAVLAAFELGKRRLLILRDRLLVQEGQEMSRLTFWSDDEP